MRASRIEDDAGRFDVVMAMESALHDTFVACTEGPEHSRLSMTMVVPEIRARLPEAMLHDDMEAAWSRVLALAPRADVISYDEFATQWNDAIDMCLQQDKFSARFEVVGQIGKGAFASVMIAFDRELRRNVALKVYDADKSGKALAEVKIWKVCAHQNIISLLDVIATPKRLYIILELAMGGQLLSKIDEVERFDETQARDIFRQCASAIQYLHETAGIAHRDLKPENLLCSSQQHGEIGDVKLSDFGFATRILTEPVVDHVVVPDEPAPGASFIRKRLMSKTRLTTLVGTPDYMAPEQVRMLQRRRLAAETGGEAVTSEGELETYDESVDCWALGCIAYELLNGSPPFVEADDELLNELILHAPLEMEDGPVWGAISAEAKDLIRLLLERDPAKRITAKEALAHAWLRQGAPKLLALPESRHLQRQMSRSKNRQMIKALRDNQRFRVSGLVVKALTRMSSNSLLVTPRASPGASARTSQSASPLPLRMPDPVAH